MLPMPQNHFKAALAAKQAQIGLWVGLCNANAAEALATTGYDWLLLDGEHAPNDPASVLEQLRAVAPYPVHPVVRPVIGDVALIKQYLDVGAQTLLVPMVDTAEQAETMVKAMRYAPAGIRGMGAALARASRYNQVDDYLAHADAQMCLLVQAETTTAIANLEAIANTEGVDGVFFGPADLSASMGYPGQPGHPEVVKTMLDGIATVRKAGKAPGILMTDPVQAQRYLDAGALFVAVGVDMLVLVAAAQALAQRFKAPGTAAAAAKPGY
ncbi:MAG TPA: 4-hydroxy-2-oxoheptanedioate aldolase [Aquabacterium sp.]|nr:4-hydroxy-2-oxoheptanedioate aldolase [Aquabacterium sp.]HQC97702.1 4-hydroxy-2-oxoheptanedioate aldolase [Aquabacterium sp.]